jgi:hypothetical protein
VTGAHAGRPAGAAVVARARRPAGAAVVALALALALAGCGDGGASKSGGSPARGTDPPRAPSAERELQRLLDRRAAALEAHRAAAYAATATGPQRAEDRAAARNARELELRDVRFTADDIAVDGDRAVLRVRAGYRVAGVRGRFEAERRIQAAKTQNGWRVRSQTSRRQLHPWEVGPVAERRSRHFVVLAPAGLAVDELGLTGALESGYERMRGVLSQGSLRRRYLVVVAGDARQARRMTEGIRGVASLAAISDTAVREQGAADRVVQVSSQRLLIVWPAFAALDAEGRDRVVAHELTHAALASVTSGRTPGWLVEGVALYVSGDRRVAEAAQLVTGEAPATHDARKALTLTGLSRPDAVARLGGEGQSAAYAYSSSAAFYIAERYGRERFLDLYDAFNDEDLAGDAGPRLTDRAVRRVLRMPLLRLERNLRRWIVTRALVAPEAP